jgi:hypothetical protein
MLHSEPLLSISTWNYRFQMADDAGSLFTNHITQLGTVCGCPIENHASIGAKLYSYDGSDAGFTIDYLEQ